VNRDWLSVLAATSLVIFALAATDVGIQTFEIIRYGDVDRGIVRDDAWAALSLSGPIAVAAAILPLAWALAWAYRAWRRTMPKGICHHCGYDLRATPERCPECGMVPKKLAETSN
jgi:hypothetical protein